MSTMAFGDSHKGTRRLKRHIERIAERILDDIRDSRADSRKLNKAIELLKGAAILINNEDSRGSSGRHHGCATLYKHYTFRGKALTIQPGKSIDNLRRVGFDDLASSVQVSRGCRLTLFQHPQFGGFSKTYGPGSYARLARINDESSSAQCNCRRHRR